MNGGGSKTTTQTTGSTNPAVDQTVTKLLGGLNTQIDNGTPVFNQSLYAGLSPTTNAALTDLSNTAGANSAGLNNAYGWAQGTVANGGYNDALRGAQGSYQSQIDNGGYNDALRSAQGGIEGYLRESQANAPGYAQLRQNGINDALTGVGSSFLTDGRFGSSVMGDAAGEAATDTALGYDYQNYTDRLSRQLSGNQALAGIGQTAYGNMTGATSGLAGVGQTAMGNAGNAAAAMPGLYGATLQPAQTQLGIGQMLDTDAQARLMGQNDLFRRQNDSGWSTLGQASSILAGTAGSSPQSTSTTTPTAPWWQTALGGAIGLGSAFL